MNIVKYGYTQAYGYGFCRGTMGDKPFDPNAVVYVKSQVYEKWIAQKIKAGGQTEKFFLTDKMPSQFNNPNYFMNMFMPYDTGIGVYLKKQNNNGFYNNIKQERQNMFVILNGEDEQWYEYFTGERINSITQTSVKGDISIISNDLYIDADKSDIPTGIKQLSIYNPKICDALTFSESVKSFSNSEIQEMVRQIVALQQDARKWGTAYDHVIDNIRIARGNIDGKKSRVESDIASGFGKYASNSSTSQKDTTNRSTEQRKEPDYPEELKQMWIRQGKCIYCGGELKSNEITQIRFCRKCGNKFSM